MKRMLHSGHMEHRTYRHANARTLAELLLEAWERDLDRPEEYVQDVLMGLGMNSYVQLRNEANRMWRRMEGLRERGADVMTLERYMEDFRTVRIGMEMLIEKFLREEAQ